MSDTASRSAVPGKPDARPSRWPRRLTLAGLISLFLLALLAGGAKWFLCSQQFKSLLADRLQAVMHGRLRIATVDAGVNSTSIHDVELVEQSTDKPWAKIEHVEAKMPLLKLLSGAPEADSIHLQKVAVTLRFDKHNHLTTVLPERRGPLPELPLIEVSDGSLIIEQEGRKPFHLVNLDGKAVTKDGKAIFKGTIADPTWGKWSVTIGYDPISGVNEMSLKAEGVAVKQPMLSALPFVTPKAWSHVECNGDTRADITFRTTSEEKPLQYKISLEPSATQVHVSSIDLDAQHASGKVLIEDGLVTLTGVQGQAAKGQIAVNGTLDFRRPEYVHHFAVRVHDLELQLLPRKWKIPSALSGLLSGNADLVVRVENGKVGTSGEGEGTIDRARLSLVTFRNPIRVKLLADGQGFHFLPLLPEL